MALAHSYFEMMIERQLKQNISRYEKCWFFFDLEYFRYLQNENLCSSKINFEWLLEYMQKGILTVFGVKSDGTIKEILDTDFDLIKNKQKRNLSEINRATILSKVLKEKGYTSEEIRTVYGNKQLAQNKDAFSTWLRKKNQPSRIKKMGYILQSMSIIDKFDALLSGDFSDLNRKLNIGMNLGILKYTSNKWYLVDEYEILEYFPSYQENYLFWDRLIHKRLDFNNLVIGDNKDV